MKSIALPLSASLFLLFASCSDDHPAKNSGDEQVPQPVVNSGPETEAERANTAVQDSTKNGNDKDSTASNSKDRH